MNEFELIKKYFLPLTIKNSAANFLQDDVAKISLKKDEELILSKDVMIEDVHFVKDDGAYNIASKLLLSNLSDLASSGATPLYYMLGFTKPKNNDEKFYADFSAGLRDVSKKYKISLIGGDTVASPDRLFFSITIFGKKNKKAASLGRSSAKAGDLIFISGTIGDAFLGLQITKKNLPQNKYLLSRHFLPTAQIKLGEYLAKNKIAHAAIDVSDGLLADLNHICEASNLSATIFQNKIPISKSAQNILKNSQFKIADLISGGDDYELIFTCSKNQIEKIEKLSKDLNIPLTCIGEFSNQKTKSPKITLLDDKSQPLTISKYGYIH